MKSLNTGKIAQAAMIVSCLSATVSFASQGNDAQDIELLQQVNARRAEIEARRIRIENSRNSFAQARTDSETSHAETDRILNEAANFLASGDYLDLTPEDEELALDALRRGDVILANRN